MKGWVGPVGAVALVAVLLVTALPAAPTAHHLQGAASESSSLVTPSASLPPVVNYTYNSSTDGFPLIYGEKLPVGFSASQPHPLIVYLHGEGKNSSWVRGGAGTGLAFWLTDHSLDGAALRKFLANASAFNAIVIGPSPRSNTGMYANSPCGGPEEQDTIDAIAVEKTRRNISDVYLFGFSMGSFGAITIAGHHPGLVKGIAVTGTFTDAFEEFAYRPGPGSGLMYIACNARPSTSNATTVQLFSYLSVLRFHPQNFSGIRIWASSGGKDHGATNNGSLWPYFHVNNTFQNSTCLVASAYAEPANCTLPFRLLHAQNPSAYAYRTVYEAQAPHMLAQLDAIDIFQYLFGLESGGCFTSTYPPTVLAPCK
jgi:pimeloyl-ACP methyl ester carboxylesterase